MHRARLIYPAVASCLLCGCIGGSKSPAGGVAPAPVVNTTSITVDTGPAAATGAINHAYVSVRVCAPGSATACTTLDHVLLDTGSWGLRLVRSVLTADSVTLPPETDAQGLTLEECAQFAGGSTWGPVATADVTIAGESAAKVPVQIMDDTGAGAAPPPACGAGGTPINGVADWLANGVLGIGVFAQDCGTACVGATTPPAQYYGCSTGGACTAENVALTAQVSNPATLFAADNNGIIVSLPALQNANGDTTVQGELTFGLGTQSDNTLPDTGLTVLGADAGGDFATTYNGAAVALPALLDSGADAYLFDDPGIAVCTSAAWVGYYCPATAPLGLSAANASATATDAVVTGGGDVVNFAVGDPDSFVATASAFSELAGGRGSTRFTWGMPFFYGRKIYIGFDGRTSGSFKGPYYAY
jgi:hypothetical protein